MMTVHSIRKPLAIFVASCYGVMSLISSFFICYDSFCHPDLSSLNYVLQVCIALGIPGAIVIGVVSLLAVVGVIIHCVSWFFTGKGL